MTPPLPRRPHEPIFAHQVRGPGDVHPRIDGARLYQKCRERGILIRHFSDPAIAQYNRVTIGAEEEMETFLTMVRDILREEGL